MIKMPNSIVGKWSAGIGIVLVVTMVIEVLFAAAIGGDPAVIEASPFLTILANILSVLFTLSFPLSLLFGIFTAIKYKDWSIFKYLGVLYSITLLLFLCGEFLFLH